VTALVWDEAGDRRYESGLDRGVLYIPGQPAVVWNGLVSIIETRSREIKSYYLDGVKYQDHVIPGDYSAKLTAFTYPDELDLLVGNAELAPGVTVYDQPTKTFNLCYRTGVVNDIVGFDFGYKIHIVYNLKAVQSESSAETISETISANPFEWDLTGVPIYLDGFRATNHLSVYSRKMDPIALLGLENRLYGTATEDASLPTFGALVDLVTS